MTWAFPFSMGEEDDTFELWRDAILEEMRRYGFEAEEGSTAEIEACVDAIALDMIWSINRRVAGQNTPRRMIEGLITWESAMRLRPTGSQGDNDRRRAVAARMRGYNSNNLASDIDPAVAELADNSYVEDRVLAEADVTTYWPGVNPGPPGFEYASNRAHFAFELTAAGVEQGAFLDRRDRSVTLVDEMRPDHNTFEVGTDPDNGFIVGQSIVGQSLLA